MFTATKAAPKTAKEATSLADFPEYREAVAKLEQLKLERDALQLRLDKLLAGINSTSDDTPARRRERSARAVLDGQEPAGTDLAGLLEERERVTSRLAIQRRAIELQEREVADARARASAEICTTLRPKYRELVARIAGLLVELGSAVDEEREFRDAALGAGVAFASHLPPTVLPGMSLAEYGSRLNGWLDDMERDHRVSTKAKRGWRGRP